MSTKQVLQFRVVLREIEPPIWRRIQVPATYSFWDLHVALQDSMGWLDCHLHAFHIGDPESGSSIEIGIPDDDGFEDQEPCLPGWEVPIGDFFVKPGDRALYAYDFGDGWEHSVVLEAIAERVPRKRYPVCIAGERACPPEDCGGVPGYEELLQVIQDPSRDDHEEMLRWLGRRFEPDVFTPSKVKFDNPAKRWNMAFASEV
jgi:hypothetical protein